MKIVSSSILLSSLITFVSIAKEPLRFVVNHPGSAPYLYFDQQSNSYDGIIPEILKALIDSNQLKIKYISNSRKRSEEYMYQGNADLIMLSKSWLKYPNKLIVTTPIHQHRSYLYKADPFANNFSLNNSDKVERLCTRKGYLYPNLARYLDSGRLIRTDSSDHLSMFRMLFKHRCDFAIMNEFNATNIMNSSYFTNEKLYRSKAPISEVPLNIVLRPELTNVKTILDKHIEQLKQNNNIQKLIDKHIKVSDFN